MSNCRCACQRPEPTEALLAEQKKVKSLETKLVRRDLKISDLERDLREAQALVAEVQSLIEHAVTVSETAGWEVR